MCGGVSCLLGKTKWKRMGEEKGWCKGFWGGVWRWGDTEITLRVSPGRGKGVAGVGRRVAWLVTFLKVSQSFSITPPLPPSPYAVSVGSCLWGCAAVCARGCVSVAA